MANFTLEPRKFVAVVARDLKPHLSYSGTPQTTEEHYELSLPQALVLASKMAGKPIHPEHSEKVALGKVTRAWMEEDVLLAEFALDTDQCQASVEMSSMIDLGFGRDVSLSHYRSSLNPVELTVCNRGARHGTHIISGQAQLPESIVVDGNAKITNWNSIREHAINASSSQQFYCGDDLVIANSTIAARLLPPQTQDMAANIVRASLDAPPSVVVNDPVSSIDTRNVVHLKTSAEQKGKQTIPPVVIGGGTPANMAALDKLLSAPAAAPNRPVNAPAAAAAPTGEQEPMKDEDPLISMVTKDFGSSDASVHARAVAVQKLYLETKELTDSKAKMEAKYAEMEAKMKQQEEELKAIHTRDVMMSATRSNADAGRVDPSLHQSMQQSYRDGTMAQVSAYNAQQSHHQHHHQAAAAAAVNHVTAEQRLQNEAFRLMAVSRQGTPAAVSLSAPNVAASTNYHHPAYLPQPDNKNNEVSASVGMRRFYSAAVARAPPPSEDEPSYEDADCKVVRASVRNGDYHYTVSRDHVKSVYHGIPLGPAHLYEHEVGLERISASRSQGMKPDAYNMSYASGPVQQMGAADRGVTAGYFDKRAFSRANHISEFPRDNTDHNAAHGWGPSTIRSRPIRVMASAGNEGRGNYINTSGDAGAGNITVPTFTAFPRVMGNDGKMYDITRTAKQVLGCTRSNHQVYASGTMHVGTVGQKGAMIPYNATKIGGADTWTGPDDHKDFLEQREPGWRPRQLR